MKKSTPARASVKTRSPHPARAVSGAPPQSASNPAATGLAGDTVKLAILFSLAVLIGFALYGPAANGPFLFDDRYLPFLALHLIGKPISDWFVGLRPLVNLSFWLNAQISADDTWSYHALNVFLHVCNSFSVLLIARWFLKRLDVANNRLNSLAVLAGAIFLVHPLQTEAVAYISSRSETLAVFFFYAAFVAFLYRRERGVSWTSTILILGLFAAAQLTKEYAAVFPLILLLTDWFFPTGPEHSAVQTIKSNRRLYTVMLVGVGVAGAAIVRVLSSATTAGFGIKEAGPVDYFLTQGRAIWTYLRLAFLPFGQNVDPDFPFTHGLSDPLALLGLLLLAAGAVAAYYFRKSYPLASVGYLAMLICLAPTSSFLPISDPFAEHRMYLPSFALILIVLDFLRRWRVEQGTLTGAAVCALVVLSYLTFQRNAIWGNELALWQDAAIKSPKKVRPHFQFAFTQYSAGHCPEAVKAFEQTASLAAPTFDLLHDWGEAEDCAGNEAHALQLFQQAAQAHPSGLISSQIAMVYAKQSRYPEALATLDQAAAQDPSLPVIYAYRGNIFLIQHDYAKAADQFEQALARDPENHMAAQGLPLARQHLAGR